MTKKSKKSSCLLSRRYFLFASASTVSTLMIPLSLSGATQQVPAQVGTFPKRGIARLSELKLQEPVYFNFPDSGPFSTNILVKLGQPAGGGIGPDRDIVAFNLTCTHRGGSLGTSYKPENASLGPCPMHLSSFDMTRHGILITGMATESLPQIILEVEDDDIMAIGVLGLFYGD